MRVKTFEATVEHGIIKLPEDAHLPEKTKVYVVVPGVSEQPAYYIGSPRLVHLEQAVEFVKEVIEEGKDANLR